MKNKLLVGCLLCLLAVSVFFNVKQVNDFNELALKLGHWKDNYALASRLNDSYARDVIDLNRQLFEAQKGGGARLEQEYSRLNREEMAREQLEELRTINSRLGTMEIRGR